MLAELAVTRTNEPVPCANHSTLPGAFLAVIFADNSRALRNEQNAIRRAVINILRNLGRDLVRQVRLDAGDQRWRDMPY